MFDYLKQESIDDVISAFYEVIKIITHNKNKNDLKLYIKEGLYGGDFPTLENLELALRIFEDIQETERTPINDISQKKKNSYLKILSNCIDVLSVEDLSYKQINGIKLLRELHEIGLFPESFNNITRMFKISKSIKPGLNEGEFNISLRIYNIGDVELRNVIVEDRIPAGFNLNEFTPPKGTTHEIVEVAGESELYIKFSKIKVGTLVSINYNCSGIGDYPRSEPLVLISSKKNSSTSNKSAGHSTITETPQVSIKVSQLREINDTFIDIFNQVDKAITGEMLSKILEEKKNLFPPGPILHQLVVLAKELSLIGDKIIAGSLRDKFVAKLKDLQAQF